MIDKLKSAIARYDELALLMSKPDATHNMKTFTNMAREHSELAKLVDEAKNYIDIYEQIRDDEEILNGDDTELKELVKDEIGVLRENFLIHEEKLKILLIPKDPYDDKNTILEIRSGTGGDEAALFAGVAMQVNVHLEVAVLVLLYYSMLGLEHCGLTIWTRIQIKPIQVVIMSIQSVIPTSHPIWVN